VQQKESSFRKDFYLDWRTGDAAAVLAADVFIAKSEIVVKFVFGGAPRRWLLRVDQAMAGLVVGLVIPKCQLMGS
jgi:hypothetical protein